MSNHQMALDNTPEFSLRPADSEDYSFAHDLVRNNLKSYCQMAGKEWDSDLFKKTWEHMCNIIVTQPAEQQADKAIGLVSLHVIPPEATLWELHLLPECRGQGIGKKLLQYSIDSARNLNCSVLILNVFKHNPALHLYRHMGFQVASESEHEYIMHLELT